MGVRSALASTLTRAGRALGSEPGTAVEKAFGGAEPPAMRQAARDVSQMDMSNLFAPGEPIHPADGYSRTPRGWNYTTGYNIAARPRLHERVSFDVLKQLITAYDTAQIAIWHRIDSLRSLDWQLVAADGYAGDVTGAIDLGKQALAKPDRVSSFGTWFAKWMYDVLAYDAGCLYRQRNRAGRCVSLKVVDGTTIAPLTDYWGDPPADPAEAYVQYVNGLPWNWLTRKDLVYEPFRPHSDGLYGHAPLEAIITNANTDLRFQVYFLQRFTEGNVPEAFASAPEGWSPDEIERFQAYWDDLMYGDQTRKHQLRWMPGGAKITWSNEKDFSDVFSLFMMRKTASAYHVTPADLGFTENVNRSSGESQADVQHRVGDLPLGRYAEGILTHWLYDDLGLPLKFQFDWGEEQDDRLQQAQADDLYIKNGTLGVSEARQMRFGLAEPEGQVVPRFIYSNRAGAIPLSALMDVAGPVDAATGAPVPGATLPHHEFAPIEGVVPVPPPKVPALAERLYGPEAIPPPPVEQGAPVEEGAPVAKETAPAEGITSETGLTSYDLIGQDDDDDEDGPQQDVLKEIATFRRFAKARIRGGQWRDFQFHAVSAGDARSLNTAGREAVAKASGCEISPRSGMISLDLPEGLIEPVPGGLTDHHITVVYLGSDVDDATLATALARARDAAAAMDGPLTGTMSGLGTFPPGDGSDGLTPAWAAVALPGAERLREALADLSASEHPDWTPHVTLAYVAPGQAMPAPLDPVPVTFGCLSVHLGGEVVATFPLGPAEIAKAGGAAPKAAAWPGWELDQQAAAYWQAKIGQAAAGILTAAVLERIARDYLTANPQQQGNADGKQRRNDAALAWLLAWLAAAGITISLDGITEGIVTDAQLIGAISAVALLDGTQADRGGWSPGATAKARKLLETLGVSAALAAVLTEAVTSTGESLSGALLYGLARALAGTDGATAVAEVVTALQAALTGASDVARSVIGTLTTWAGKVAQWLYGDRGVAMENLLILPDACVICQGIADGNPYPAGTLTVPEHVNCRCQIGPASGSS